MPSIELGVDPVNPEVGGDLLGVEPERRPGQRTGAVRGVGRDPGVPLGQPVEVADERPRVGEQVVRQQHRLGVLEVRAARHGHPEVPLGLRRQRLDQLAHQLGDLAAVVAEEQPEQGRDLVVAGPAGPEPTAEVGAEALDQPALQRGVDVLVVGLGDELTRGDVGGQGVDAVEERRQAVVVEQPGAVQHRGVRLRAGQVVRREPPVEVGRAGQLGERRGRSGREPATPQAGRLLVGIVGCRRSCRCLS